MSDFGSVNSMLMSEIFSVSIKSKSIFTDQNKKYGSVSDAKRL